MLTVAECAKDLRCGAKLIRKHIDAGTLPFVDLNPNRSGRYRTIRVRRLDLERLKMSGANLQPAKALASMPTRTQKGQATSRGGSSVLDLYESRRGNWHRES